MAYASACSGEHQFAVLSAEADSGALKRPVYLKHFPQPEVLEFCSARGIRIMTDLDALRELGKQAPPPI